MNALTRVPSTVLTAGIRVKRSFRAVAGQTYRIAVDGAGARQGDIKLALRHRPVPVNDMFVAATPLVPAVPLDGDNIGATGEPSEPSPGGTAGATVWYSWTAPSTGPARVKLPTRDFAAGFAVYTGETVGSLSRVTTYSGLFRAAQGTTYRIAVDGGSAPNRGSFSILLERPTAVPNDEFANATELTGVQQSTTGTTADATREPNEPTHVYDGRTSIWYRWTAPADGTATVDLAGSSSYNEASVYVGDRVDALTRVVAAARKVKFAATAGTTYRIAVDAEYGSPGNVKIAAFLGDGPPNDQFARPTELTGLSDTEAGSTVDATLEVGEPDHTYSGSGSLWYTWTAPRTGATTVDLAGSFYDATAAVYSGTSLTGLTKMAAGRSLRFRAEQGTTYRIAVDGSYGSRGAVQIALASHSRRPTTTSQPRRR